MLSNNAEGLEEAGEYFYIQKSAKNLQKKTKETKKNQKSENEGKKTPKKVTYLDLKQCWRLGGGSRIFLQKKISLSRDMGSKLTTVRGQNESFVYCSLFGSCDFYM